jgi:hypothetical protein
MNITREDFEILDWVRPYLEKLFPRDDEDSFFFSISNFHPFKENNEVDFTKRVLGVEFQADTQERVARIRQAFGHAVWQKKWDEGSKWWNYLTTDTRYPIYIYAVKEAPKTCTAIIEKRVVKEQVPVKYEERTVEKEVIVGWKCE